MEFFRVTWVILSIVLVQVSNRNDFASFAARWKLFRQQQFTLGF
jgi:hypothetical protein